MMINIFANERVYGGWTKKACIPFNEAVPKEVYDALDEEATVVDSDLGYGKRVMFTLNHGANQIYKPLSTKSNLEIGAKIKKSACFVTVLSKAGQDDIYRITETQE